MQVLHKSSTKIYKIKLMYVFKLSQARNVNRELNLSKNNSLETGIATKENTILIPDH